MIKQILIIVLVAASFTAYSQKKDCDMQKVPNPKGGQLEYAIVKSSLGKIMVGKQDGNVVIAYMTKAVFAATSGLSNVSFKLDSATFIFQDYSKMKVAAQGFGNVSNNMQLKPQYTSIYLGIALTTEQVEILKTKLVTALHVTGERDSEGGDVFNDKASLKFQKSFTCIE